MSNDGVDGMVCRCKKCHDALRAEVERLRAEVEMLRGVGCSEDGDGPCGVCVKCLRAEVARLSGVTFSDGGSLIAWVELRTRAEAVTAVARGLAEALADCVRVLSYPKEAHDQGEILLCRERARAALARAREFFNGGAP